MIRSNRIGGAQHGTEVPRLLQVLCSEKQRAIDLDGVFLVIQDEGQYLTPGGVLRISGVDRCRRCEVCRKRPIPRATAPVTGGAFAGKDGSAGERRLDQAIEPPC